VLYRSLLNISSKWHKYSLMMDVYNLKSKKKQENLQCEAQQAYQLPELEIVIQCQIE